MIIKINMHDNDYISDIENYLKRFKFSNIKLGIHTRYAHKEDKDSIRKYVEQTIELEDLLKKSMYSESAMTKEEQQIFINYIKDSLNIYLNHNNILNKKESIDVEIVDCINNKDILNSNGEVVFYILQNDKYIIC